MKKVKLTAVELQPGADGKLPSEFRILRRGTNTTTKGDLVFDDAAARSVMAKFERHGVEVMIDLEHLSLDQESRSFDPDARGWCQLDVRDGELWAVNVRWNEDGARRLAEKRQRYVSPVVYTDDDGRVESLLNIAITALPATDNAQPLMAASRRLARTRKLTMDQDDKKDEMRAKKLAAMRGLKLSDDGAVESVAAQVEEMAPEEVVAVIEEALDVILEAADAGPAETEEMAEDKDIAASARKLTGERRRGNVIAKLAALSAKASDVTTLAAELATLKANAEERELSDLIKLNANKLDPAKEKIARDFASRYDIAAARDYIEALPVRLSRHEPTREGGANAELTAEEIHIAKLSGTDPAKLAAFKKLKGY